jgi:peptidoglycan/LPS O-acetylase OafA/YrhL
MPPVEPGEARRAGNARRAHLPALDAVRGLAIVLVLLFHLSEPFRLRESTVVGTALARGWIGVDLFFVLSGFLITGILIDTRGAPNYFSSFYLRRVLRIFPLYYGVLALWFGVGAHLGDASFFGPDRQRWYWCYLSNWGDPFGHGIGALSHFWSLAVEEQFYLVWPLLVALASRRQLVVGCAALMALAPLLRGAILWHGGAAAVEAAHRLTPARLDVLATGALLAVVVREPAWLARLTAAARRLRLPAAAALALILWRSRWLHFDDPLTLTLGYSAVAVVAATLVLAAARAQGGAWPVLGWLGARSYGIYVLHFPLHAAAMTFMQRHPSLLALAHTTAFDLAYLVVAGASACLVAAVVFANWERRFLALKERFVARPTARRADAKRSSETLVPETPIVDTNAD